jgi:hypothetical protein
MSTSLGAFELDLAIEPSQIPAGLKVTNFRLASHVMFWGPQLLKGIAEWAFQIDPKMR